MKKRMICPLLLLFLFATMVGCSNGSGGGGGGGGGGVPSLPATGDQWNEPKPSYQGSNQVDTTAMTTSNFPMNSGQCSNTGIGEFNKDKWYSYQAGGDGVISVSTCNANFDTDLAIYKEPSSPYQVACDGDSNNNCNDPFSSKIDNVPVSSGETVLIRVGGWSQSDSGTCTLNITESGAPNGSLVGTYDLIGFEVIFDDGMVFTQNDFQTFSGTMVIYSDGTFTQLVQIEGIAASVTATWEIVGSCFLVETIDPPNSCGPYCAGITFDDPFLTTVADHICGTDAVETDYWVRIGSAPANWIPDAESVALSGIEDCSNHTDDDGDGFADCEDPDCFGDADCIAARRIAPEGAGTVLGVPEDTAGRAFGMMIQGLLDR